MYFYCDLAAVLARIFSLIGDQSGVPLDFPLDLFAIARAIDLRNQLGAMHSQHGGLFQAAQLAFQAIDSAHHPFPVDFHVPDGRRLKQILRRLAIEQQLIGVAEVRLGERLPRADHDPDDREQCTIRLR